MFERVFKAVPNRPMRVLNNGVARPTHSFFVGFLCAVIGLITIITVCALSLPGIRHDWEIAKDPVIVSKARISNGRCTTSQGFYTNCTLTINYLVGKTPQKQALDFSFFSVSSGDYSVEVVNSRSQPELVTVDLALDKLWNRIIAAGMFLLFGAGMIVAGIWIVIQLRAMRRAIEAFSGKRLHAVSADIVSVVKQSGVQTLHYKFQAHGRTKKGTAGLSKKFQPFLLNDKTVLGVTDDRGAYVLLLDEALERLDFTDAERAALRDARDAAGSQKPVFSNAAIGIEPAR